MIDSKSWVVCRDRSSSGDTSLVLGHEGSVFCFCAEAPNPLNLGSKRLERKTLDKYKARRREFYVSQAAAQLWADGVPFDRALSIVQSAFDATTMEAG